MVSKLTSLLFYFMQIPLDNCENNLVKYLSEPNSQKYLLANFFRTTVGRLETFQDTFVDKVKINTITSSKPF